MDSFKENLNKFLIFARKSRKQSNPQDYNELLYTFLDLVLEGRSREIKVDGIDYYVGEVLVEWLRRERGGNTKIGKLREFPGREEFLTWLEGLLEERPQVSFNFPFVLEDSFEKPEVTYNDGGDLITIDYKTGEVRFRES